MKILITNIFLSDFAGTECYVKDLVICLKNIGHNVEIYTTKSGLVAEEVIANGINVVTSLSDLKNVPDIIHAHHRPTTLSVIQQFPNIPVVFFCHSGTIDIELPRIHENIVKYVAVDRFCLEALLKKNIPIENTQIICNWIDTNKFNQKKTISEIPNRALIVSAMPLKFIIPIIREGCSLNGIELTKLDFTDTIEKEFSKYDLVFAKAKMAMEAMACGCATILFGYNRIGEMVTKDNFESAKEYNFGYKKIQNKITTKYVSDQIKKYDSENVRMVSDSIRDKNDFKKILKEIISLYEVSIDNWSRRARA